MEQTLHKLQQLLSAAVQPPAPGTVLLKVLQVSVGNSIRMVPLSEVVYFEAADKYVRVLTASHEYLIRTPLKDLLPPLAQAYKSRPRRRAASCNAGNLCNACSADRREIGACTARAARILPFSSHTGTASASSPSMNSWRSSE